MRSLKEIDLKEKRVLVRCDFNVPLGEGGVIKDDFRITQTLPTIDYLIRKGAKIVLMSHLGKPKGEFDKSLTLEPIAQRLKSYLDRSVKMIDIKEDTNTLKPGEVAMIENLRFYKGEEKNDSDFARQLSGLADFYVNDAFGVCHREHASVSKIASFLPVAAGLLLEKEIIMLSTVNNPKRPLVAIIGGAKIYSKVKVIKRFLEESDHLLMGGKVANVLLAAKGLIKGDRSEKTTNGIDLTSPKIHYPIDAIVAKSKEGAGSRISSLASLEKGESIYDIGPDSINLFSDVVKEAKTIVWAGPLGMIENPLFEKGTREVGKEIVNNREAFKIAGGGDTSFALLKLKIRDKFDHVSTGGGAMLSFLAGDDLPGLKALGYETD